MENKDPLFDNIRRNAAKIDQAPSSDAWTKLEARLDKHERPAARRRKLPGLGIMSVAASVLLLVGLVFVISQTVLKPGRSIANTGKQAMLHQIEDLPLLASNEAISSPQMAEYQRKINANPRGIIKEGGYHKKLVAQPIRQNQMVTMNHFDWILGTWKSTTSDGVSTETWEMVVPGQFKGTGTFKGANNSFTFTEEMMLFEENNKIYFEAITQSEGEKVRYELQKLENNWAIFQNETVDFPSHVLIVRNNTGGFTISFKNIPPSAVPENNILLKNGSNTLGSKKIVRKLNRKI